MPGTLHPPLAAAMVRLAAPHAGDRIVDPCCGAGTIPIEAAAYTAGARLLGSDRDPAALRAARANAAGTTVGWALADAGQLPLADGTVEAVITNPPWDRQVPPSGLLANDPAMLWHELRRVLAPRGRAVVLLHDAGRHLDHLDTAGLHPDQAHPVSLAGTHPAIVTLRPR